jgi:hypothetical protein
MPSAELPAINRLLYASMWWTALVLVVSIAALLLIRRVVGALVDPLSGIELVGVTAVLTTLVVALQLAAQRERLTAVVLALTASVGLAAMTMPGTPPWTVGLSWFGLVTAQSAVFVTGWRRLRIHRRSSIRSPVMVDEGEEAISEQLVQQISRERIPAGGESIHALVRATIPPGDRLAAVHLAFCPPLDAAPRLSAHVLDDSGAEAKITLAESYGSRIEVRLPTVARHGQTVLLEVLGESRPA